jgi:cellulose synthase/poly-beta-1,6-N-acetylglucosamine synthase-like glycosyltransferase
MRVANFDFWDGQNILLWAVLTVMAASFLIQLYYYLIIFRRVGLKQRKENPAHLDEPVSIIVCIKNDSLNLSKILPLLLEQDYPEYEVIVVNDNSSDDTEEVLKQAQSQYVHLQIRKLVANNSVYGKSIVLGVGIKAAKYNRLAIIDVTGRPSTGWLKSVSTGFDSDIVTGYIRYITVGKFVRIANYYESLFRLGYALNRRPYTASGENECFRKELFFKNGFNPLLRKLENVEQVFFNSVMNKRNTSVVLSTEAIVESEKGQTFGNWCRECSVNIFSKRLFRRGTRHVKLPEIISRTLFYSSFIAAIVMTYDETWMQLQFSILGLFILRLTIQLFVFVSTQKRLGEKKLLLHTLFWDCYSVIVYLYIILLFRHRKAIKYQ